MKEKWTLVASSNMCIFLESTHTRVIVLDHFSRYIYLALLIQTLLAQVMQETKSIFAKYNIPEILISDSGPQFTFELFLQFSENLYFQHHISSPHYHQRHG